MPNPTNLTTLPAPELRPEPWDLRVSAAYLRLLGVSQTDVAAAVDRTPRCLRLWETHPSWEGAKHEATTRWLRHATNQARVTVTQGIIQGDLSTARWLLERVDPLFQKEPDGKSHNYSQHNSQHNHIHIGDNGNGKTGDDDQPDPVERGAAVLRILLEATRGQAGLPESLDAEADEVHPPYTDA